MTDTYLPSSKLFQSPVLDHAATAPGEERVDGGARICTGATGKAGAPMSIIALDPGTTQTGWCVLLGSKVVSSGIEPNTDVLARLRFGWPHIGRAQLAIEMIASYGMPVGREVFETCVWIGRFVQAWPDPDAVRFVYRRDVKAHLCASQKAKDSHVWQAIVDLYGGDSVAVGRKASPGPLYGVKSHARSALGVALTARDTAPAAAEMEVTP
jgi:hypothetical protein